MKAYSLGRQRLSAKGASAALPFFQRAVQLDPDFATAYAAIAVAYNNLHEAALTSENARKAYTLREKVSERERLHIESMYYAWVTGELDKAVQLYEVWQQIYPRHATAYNNLGVIYLNLGKYENALGQFWQAQRLDPNVAIVYVNLAYANECLNRFDEAESVLKQARQRNLQHELLSLGEYELAFLRGEPSEMSRLVAPAVQPGVEQTLLSAAANTAAWYGQLSKAEQLTRQAAESAERNRAKEAAASYLAVAVLPEAEAGNRSRARANADAALFLAKDKDIEAMAALGLARAGDLRKAEALANDLTQNFPADTLVQHYWLPTIRAALELQRKNAARAIELLQAASAYELGTAVPGFVTSLWPVYVRGQAYLVLGDGEAAVTEFQKFIYHRGLVANFPLGALARLGLARAYALQGDTAKARTAYQDFLALWKDADPDIPILKQAKAEYAKLL